jgi:hypothetical protein
MLTSAVQELNSQQAVLSPAIQGLNSQQTMLDVGCKLISLATLGCAGHAKSHRSRAELLQADKAGCWSKLISLATLGCGRISWCDVEPRAGMHSVINVDFCAICCNAYSAVSAIQSALSRIVSAYSTDLGGWDFTRFCNSKPGLPPKC